MQRPLPLPLLALAAALCLGTPLPTRAADDPAPDCDAPATQADMNRCAGQAYERADAHLVQLYAELMPKLGKEQQARARTGQRVWLRYRDLQCDYEAAQHTDGSVEFTARSNCLARLTEQRNQTLQNMLDQARP